MRGNLKAERARRGLKVKDVAKRIGVSDNTISAWENGVSTPTAHHLMKLSELFNSTPAYLLADTQQKNLSTNTRTACANNK